MQTGFWGGCGCSGVGRCWRKESSPPSETAWSDGAHPQSAAKFRFRRRRMRVFIRPLLFVLTGVFVLTACGGSTAAPATQDNSPADVKIMVGGLNKQIYIPNKLAEILGYFKEQ